MLSTWWCCLQWKCFWWGWQSSAPRSQGSTDLLVELRNVCWRNNRQILQESWIRQEGYTCGVSYLGKQLKPRLNEFMRNQVCFCVRDGQKIRKNRKLGSWWTRKKGSNWQSQMHFFCLLALGPSHNKEGTTSCEGSCGHLTGPDCKACWDPGDSLGSLGWVTDKKGETGLSLMRCEWWAWNVGLMLCLWCYSALGITGYVLCPVASLPHW